MDSEWRRQARFKVILSAGCFVAALVLIPVVSALGGTPLPMIAPLLQSAVTFCVWFKDAELVRQPD